MSYIVLLVPTWDLAKKMNVEATVEAEYGCNVLEGSVVTLAHHVEKYFNNPAPCNLEVPALEPGSTIVLSHIDLDSIGGTLALMGKKPISQGFWATAEFVDVQGYNRIIEMPQKYQEQIFAYNAWSDTNRNPNFQDVTDITDIILQHGEIISRIIEGDEELINLGYFWNRGQASVIESCLVSEDEFVRVFKTDGCIFTPSAYFSPKIGKVAATVSFNTSQKKITIACEDGGKKVSALVVAQQLWGAEAGGRPLMAGSPRGQEMTEIDMLDAAVAVRKALTE